MLAAYFNGDPIPQTNDWTAFSVHRAAERALNTTWKRLQAKGYTVAPILAVTGKGAK